MDHAVRLVVIHQSRLIRESLVSLLASNAAYRAMGLDPSTPDLFDLLHCARPHALVVDSALPKGLAVRLIEDVNAAGGGAKAVVLVPAESQDNLVECVAAGAHGCVLDGASSEDLHDVIRRVLRGEIYCSIEIVQSMYSELAHVAREAVWRRRSAAPTLTARELEILELINQRLSNKQIAKRLSISLYTVKNHVHHICEKLAVEDRHEAVDYARRRQWLGAGSSDRMLVE